MASIVIAPMQSVQLQTQEMPMTSWFDVPHAMWAAVNNSDEMFEVFVFAVFILAVFVWRALKGEPAILKSVRHSGSKRVKQMAKVDVPDATPRSTTVDAPSRSTQRFDAWRAKSLIKVQPSCAKISKPRQAHSEQHSCHGSVSEEAEQLVGMLAQQFTKALRGYRALVRTGKDAEIHDVNFYYAFLLASVRVGNADVVKSLLEAMRRNQVAPSGNFRRSFMGLLAAKQMHAECVLICELFDNKMPTDRVVKRAAWAFRERGNTRGPVESLDKLQAAGEEFSMPNPPVPEPTQLAVLTEELPGPAPKVPPRTWCGLSNEAADSCGLTETEQTRGSLLVHGIAYRQWQCRHGTAPVLAEELAVLAEELPGPAPEVAPGSWCGLSKELECVAVVARWREPRRTN